MSELAAVLLGMARWASIWTDKRIHLFTDFALRTGRTRCPTANSILRDILWLAAVHSMDSTVSYLPSKDNCIADALSRMDNAMFLAQVIKFFLPHGRYIWHPNYNVLAHMSHQSLYFLSRGLMKRRLTAKSPPSDAQPTRRTPGQPIGSASPVPAQPRNIARYTAFLARSLLPTSIPCYLNIVRLIHLEAGYSNPLENNWFLSTVMRGIRRCRGTPPRQKLSITPEILRAIHASLDLDDSINVAFWAACLCAFYTEEEEEYPSLTAHQHQKGHAVPKQV